MFLTLTIEALVTQSGAIGYLQLSADTTERNLQAHCHFVLLINNYFAISMSLILLFLDEWPNTSFLYTVCNYE